jgi:phospholipase C
MLVLAAGCLLAGLAWERAINLPGIASALGAWIGTIAVVAGWCGLISYQKGTFPDPFYPPFRDNPTYMRDFTAFATDLAAGKLPQVAFVKAYGFRSEHPGLQTTISDGVKFVTGVVEAVQDSAYAPDTLVLLMYDEGGGYFDHVSPPPVSRIDGQPLGTRVPVIAIGPFAKKSFISHVELEHSSVVKFIEWNWLGMQTGQLQNRDLVVNNLGSLLDPAATGTAVPEM